MTRTTRRTSRLAAYVIAEVYEPPSDDVLGPEGSSPGPAAVKTPAVRSRRACSTGTPKNAKQCRVGKRLMTIFAPFTDFFVFLLFENPKTLNPTTPFIPKP